MLEDSIPNYKEAGSLHATAKLEQRNKGLFLLWNMDDPNRFFYESLNYFINDKNLLVTPSTLIYDSDGWSAIELPYEVSIKQSTKIKTIDFNILKLQLEEKILHHIAKKLFTKYIVSEIATANNNQFQYLKELANYYCLEATELDAAIKDAKKKEIEEAKREAAPKMTIKPWHEGIYIEKTFKKPKGKELVTRYIATINKSPIQNIIAMFKKYIPSCQVMLSTSESDNVHIAYLTINSTNIS